MKAPPFRYHAPSGREEALRLLAELPEARLLAGGQSLMPMMNLRLAAPAHLIDLNSVAGLDGIAHADGVLRIGTMARQQAALDSALVRRHCPLLAGTLARVGHEAIRNRGTVGGSLAHMDPAAELPVAALALDAELTIASVRGTRSLPISALSAGYLATTLEPDEMLAEVAIPCWPDGHGWGFEEVTRRGDGFATVAAAALLLLRDGAVVRAALAVGGLGAAPVRVTAAEQALLGHPADTARLTRAAAHAMALPAEGDLHAPADYKRHLAQVLSLRALQLAAAAHG